MIQINSRMLSAEATLIDEATLTLIDVPVLFAVFVLFALIVVTSRCRILEARPSYWRFLLLLLRLRARCGMHAG